MKQIKVLCFSIFILLIIPVDSVYSADNNLLKVHFIDVGQGDSIFLQTPNHKRILIDGGPPKAGKKVVAYLKEHQINKIDLLIATHPDIDHIGGLPYIMSSFKVNQLLDSGKLHTTKTYAKYRYQIFKQHIPFHIAKENDKIKIDEELDITILNTHEKNKSNNASSIVLKVTYRDISFLFMSDVGKEEEQEIMNKYDIEANIIKIAHHGSRTSSSLDFLRKVDPEVALITYSKRNEYGHPVNRVIENLFSLQTHIYSTAVYGTTKIYTDGKRYFIYPTKFPMEGLTS